MGTCLPVKWALCQPSLAVGRVREDGCRGSEWLGPITLLVAAAKCLAREGRSGFSGLTVGGAVHHSREMANRSWRCQSRDTCRGGEYWCLARWFVVVVC